jgi:hypothetical protein
MKVTKRCEKSIYRWEQLSSSQNMNLQNEYFEQKIIFGAQQILSYLAK